MDTNIFDPNYVQKQQIASLQQMAAAQNAMRVQQYYGQAADWVTNNIRNRDLNIPLTPVPVVPKKIVVDDQGNWTEATFADVQPPTLPPPVSIASGPLKATTNVPPDRLDQVLAENAQIYAVILRIAQKLGV